MLEVIIIVTYSSSDSAWLGFPNCNKSGDMAGILKSFQEHHVPVQNGEVH